MFESAFALCCHGDGFCSERKSSNAPSFAFLPFFPPISYLQYGDVLNVIVSSKKKGSAVVEFATVRAAVSTLSQAASLFCLSDNENYFKADVCINPDFFASDLPQRPRSSTEFDYS